MTWRATLFVTLSVTLVVVSYLHLSEQRFSEAHDQATAAYSACDETRPSPDCATAADALFEAVTKHRRVDAAAGASGILATAWVLLICYGRLERLVARRRR